MGRRWDDSVKRFIGKEAEVEDQNGKIFVGVIEAMLYNYGKVVLLESDIPAVNPPKAIIVNNVANIGILKKDYARGSEEDRGAIAKERVKSLLDSKEEG